MASDRRAERASDRSPVAVGEEADRGIPPTVSVVASGGSEESRREERSGRKRGTDGSGRGGPHRSPRTAGHEHQRPERRRRNRDSRSNGRRKNSEQRTVVFRRSLQADQACMARRRPAGRNCPCPTCGDLPRDSTCPSHAKPSRESASHVCTSSWKASSHLVPHIRSPNFH